MNNPIQPLYNSNGVFRFKSNKIVEMLLDKGPFDMNSLADMDFSRDDREQFAQLIGYSLNGFAELSYASDDVYDIAAAMLENNNEQASRIDVMQKKLCTARSVVKELAVELFQIHPDDLKE